MNDLSCPEISNSKLKKIRYDKELIDYFFTYNLKCLDLEADVIGREAAEKRDMFNISIRPGLNLYNISFQNEFSRIFKADFENALGYRLGLECEFVVPFNKNKWAVIFEPTFQSLKDKSSYTRFIYSGDITTENEIKYSSIEIPLKIRYYVYLTDSMKLFANVGWNFDFALGSNVKIGTDEFDIDKGQNFCFGVGLVMGNKYNLELKYNTKRNFYNGSSYYSEDNYVTSLIFGYTLF